jgi:hypothetical protein
MKDEEGRKGGGGSVVGFAWFCTLCVTSLDLKPTDLAVLFPLSLMVVSIELAGAV